MIFLKILGITVFGCSALGGTLALFDPDLSIELIIVNLVFTLLFLLVTICLIRSLRHSKSGKVRKISKKEQAVILAERKAEAQNVRRAYAASLNELPLVAAPASMVLKPGEVCHFSTPASVCIAKNQVVGYSGRSAGVSFRVAKGVSFRAEVVNS